MLQEGILFHTWEWRNIGEHVIVPIKGEYARKPLTIIINGAVAEGIIHTTVFTSGSSGGLAIRIRNQLYGGAVGQFDACISQSDMSNCSTMWN